MLEHMISTKPIDDCGYDLINEICVNSNADIAAIGLRRVKIVTQRVSVAIVDHDRASDMRLVDHRIAVISVKRVAIAQNRTSRIVNAVDCDRSFDTLTKSDTAESLSCHLCRILARIELSRNIFTEANALVKLCRCRSLVIIF